MWDCDDLDDDDHDLNGQAPKLVPHQGEGRRVGIVGRGVPGSGSGQGFLNQLLKQTQVPKFSGDPIQFGSWKWQFDRFLRDAETTYGKLTESQKLTALENALPEKYRERLIMLQRLGKPVHCEAFLATLGTQLESVTEFQLLQRWNNIGLPYSGKLGLEHLVEMELEFDSLRHHLS